MESERFNLVTEPWIPIVGKGRVSLMDVFSDDSLIDIEGNAIQKLSMIKLMIAIAQASVRIPDDVSWKDIGKEGLADRVRRYLISHKDCFYLYGDKPFLQIPAIKKLPDIEGKQIFIDYIPDLASDNDSLLWKSQDTHHLDDADKALFIVCLMNYALGGKRVGSAVPLTFGFEKSKSAKAGPGIGGANGYLSTFLKGSSLKETVWLNYFTDDVLEEISDGVSLDVRPPWEDMPKGEDDARARELKASIYAWLCALCRFVYLSDDLIFYVEGLQYLGSVKAGYYEPFITINRMRGAALYVDVAKKPWRSLSAILEAAYKELDGDWSCTIVRKFLHRTRNNVSAFALWTGGLRVRTTTGDQSIKQSDDYVESEFALESSCIGAEFYRELCSEIDYIDNVSRVLLIALMRYFNKAKIKDWTVKNKVMTRFWACADSLSDRLISSCQLMDMDGIQEVQQRVWNNMLAIYDDICPHENALDFLKWIKCRPERRGDV